MGEADSHSGNGIWDGWSWSVPADRNEVRILPDRSEQYVPEDGMTFVIRMRDAVAPATAGQGTVVGREAAAR